MKTSIPPKFFPGDLIRISTRRERDATVTTLLYVVIASNEESFRLMNVGENQWWRESATLSARITNELLYEHYSDGNNSDLSWEIL